MQETFSGGDACRQMTTGAHRHGPRGGIFLRTFLGFLALTLATADVQAGMGMISLQSGALNLASGDFATAFTSSTMEWTGGALMLGDDVTATIAKELAHEKTVELAAGSVLTVSGTNDNAALTLNASGTGTVSVGLGTSYGLNVLLSLIHI